MSPPFLLERVIALEKRIFSVEERPLVSPVWIGQTSEAISIFNERISTLETRLAEINARLENPHAGRYGVMFICRAFTAQVQRFPGGNPTANVEYSIPRPLKTPPGWMMNRLDIGHFKYIEVWRFDFNGRTMERDHTVYPDRSGDQG